MITHSPRAAEDPGPQSWDWAPSGRELVSAYFVTGATRMNTGPFWLEQAPNGNGTIFALVWFGGSTANPAAVVGLHRDPETGANSTTMTALYAERAPGEARVTSSCGCLCL